ncbi:MAG: cell division protein FtsL [Steroidobacteraceae bacterium]
MRLTGPRSLLLTVPLLWFAVLGSAAAVIHCKHRARALFIELDGLNASRDDLNIEWGQLELERSAWSSQALVERKARKQLHMTIPAPQDIRLVSP